MDPLSDVLSVLRINSYWSGGFDWGGEWCLAFGAHEEIMVYAVISGTCWLAVEGVAEPIHGQPGDCVLLPGGRPFRVGSDLTLPPTNALALAADEDGPGITVRNGGGDFLVIGCSFGLAGDHADFLLDVLPPVVHIHQEADKATLRWCIDRMQQELREPQPGGFLVAQQLATLLLVQALRVHLATEPRGGGWLSALADPQIRVAITAMHDEPGKAWTVKSLAKKAGMSRTSFAVKFKRIVGQAPLEYLGRWRMLRAADQLTRSNDSLLSVAQSLGYQSESAFGTAFKRIMGCSPRRYGRVDGKEPS